jgi:O-antigen biosynthesis protein
MNPLVSVVLPAWNAADCAGRAVRGVLAQSLRDWELIVVDDGSTDETAAAVAAAAGGDARVRVLRRPQGGIVRALEAGMAEARGRFIGGVGVRGARDFVRSRLTARSWVEGRDFIMAA